MAVHGPRNPHLFSRHFLPHSPRFSPHGSVHPPRLSHRLPTTHDSRLTMTISAKAKWTESSFSRITPGRLVIERVSEGGLCHPRIYLLILFRLFKSVYGAMTLRLVERPLDE